MPELTHAGSRGFRWGKRMMRLAAIVGLLAAFAAEVHAQQLTGWVDWDWLRNQPSVDEALDGGVRHLRLASAIQILVDGSSGRGVIREP